MKDELGRVGVLGVGNVLRSDDGVGPFVVRVLESEYELPDNVRVRDLGTPGPEFVDYLLGVDAAVVIDSVTAEGRPGEIRVYDRGEILAAPAPERLSPHDPGLREALLTADFAGGGPSTVVLVGVIPASTELGTELSPQVRAALPAICGEVLRKLAEMGVEATRRSDGGDSAVWWERT